MAKRQIPAEPPPAPEGSFARIRVPGNEPPAESALTDLDEPADVRGAFTKQPVTKNLGVIEAVKRAGSLRALGELCGGVSHVSVRKWIFESLPVERAIEIERHTGVSRRVLRPDIFAVEPPLVVSKPIKAIDVHTSRYGESRIMGENDEGESED